MSALARLAFRARIIAKRYGFGPQEPALPPRYIPFNHQWCPKTLREKLCIQQTFAPDRHTSAEIGRLISLLDLHRPLGSNGKHGNLHTPTCGCEDK